MLAARALAGCSGVLRLLLRVAPVLLIGACAPKSVTLLLRDPPPNLPAHAIIEAVPFVAQTEEYCGPASLAMVLRHYGQQADLDELGRAVFVPAMGGSLQAEMAALLRRKGLLAYPLDNQLESLLGQLATGSPVIVLQNLGLSIYPRWHYAVAIGYDLTSAQIILHSGQREAYRLSLKTFAYTWARSGNWALVPLPVGRFPLQADVKRVFVASTALASTPSQAYTAIPQYSAALERWPGNEAFSIALSNEHYANGNHRAAIEVLLAAASAPLKSAAVFNNLAYNLLAEQCYAAARQSVQCAVQIQPITEFVQSKLEIEGLPENRNLAKECPDIRCE